MISRDQILDAMAAHQRAYVTHGNARKPGGSVELSKLMRLLHSEVTGDVTIRLQGASYDQETQSWRAKWVVTAMGVTHMVDSVEEAQELRRAFRILDGRDPKTGEPK